MKFHYSCPIHQYYRWGCSISIKRQNYLSSCVKLDCILPRPYDERKQLLDTGRLASAYPNYKRPELMSSLQSINSTFSKTAGIPAIKVIVGGRVLAMREMGSSLTFVDLYSDGVRLQVIVKSALPDSLQRGDIIKVEGVLCQTKAGELSIRAEGLQILSPCILNVPSLHAPSMTDDHRCRWRHLDFISRPSNINIFKMRAKVIQAIRKFLDDFDFVEVETPVLSAKAGGALARPFQTQLTPIDGRNAAKGDDLFLRIAPELYLKRLIVGGMERVFEIGKVFRNEGVDFSHNPEFTMLEMYQAFASSTDMMELVKELILSITTKLKISVMEPHESFKTIEIVPSLESILNIKFKLHDEVALKNQLVKVIQEHDILYEAQRSDVGYLFDKLIGHFLEPHCQKPTFLLNHPLLMCPLAAAHPSNPLLADRFELFIDGMEIANGYSELRNPHEQRQRFQGQVHSRNPEAPIPDEDFVLALEAGMPPTGGCGIGIDRLVALFLGQNHIRDVILFPFSKQL